jgi:hypothetical protein
MLRKTNSPSPEQSPSNPVCNRYIGPVIISFLGKSFGIAGAIVTTFPQTKEVQYIAAASGLAAGISNGMSRYHLITKANISPGVILVPVGANTAITRQDEKNANIINVASTSDALLEGYKTNIKTQELVPWLSWSIVLSVFYNQLVTGIQANGQKWFGEAGKNYCDTWSGYVFNKLTTLDVQWIKKNIIDIKSMIATLKPAIEFTSQYASMLDFGILIGIPQNSVCTLAAAHAVAIVGSHTQNYAPRGYEQQIMQQSMREDSTSKKYLAWGVCKIVQLADGAAAIGAIPLDLVSIVVPPKYVLYGANILGGVACGYSLYSQIIRKIPMVFLQNSYIAIPVITIGTIGYAYSEVTSFMAAWDQTITFKNPPQELSNKEDKLQIGVVPLLKEKYGTDDPASSYTESVKKRFLNYKHYVSKNLSYYSSAVGQMGAGLVGLFKAKKPPMPEQGVELQALGVKYT